MKCSNCGQEIPEGVLYCERCGKEVRIVPDYNPLDDVLAAQIKNSVEGKDESPDDFIYKKSYTSAGKGVSSKTRHSADSRTRSGGSSHSYGQRKMSDSRRTSGVGRSTGYMDPEMREQKRRQAERKRALRKKRRIRAGVIFIAILILAVVLGIILYQNSYAGQLGKGYKAIEAKEYEEAAEYFNRCIEKNPERADAYSGLSLVYIARDDLDTAEKTFLDAIEAYPENSAIYEALVLFYQDTDQNAKVPVLLDDAKDSVRSALSEYIIEPPEFSLPDTEVFEDVQQLTLTADVGDIYYTTDGSEPTADSAKYTEPIQISEGETVIKAIAVNDKGVQSLTESKSYTVEFPIEDAPAVNPSTGQYDSPTQITIIVPEGYTAYYTMDRSDPTSESTEYTGPIAMPEGSTIFKAVLINGSGRASGITTRNYEMHTN